MGNVIYFEITSGSEDLGASFFTRAFGWTACPSPFLERYSLLRGEGAGISGAVMSQDYRDQPVILWLEVDDIRGSVAAVEEAGGRQIEEIHEIPGEGLMCYVTSPEGTVFGVKQSV